MLLRRLLLPNRLCRYFSAQASNNNVAAARTSTFTVMVFDRNGDFKEKDFTKFGLLKDTNLNARDLIVLDSGFHRRPRPSILVRKSAFIVCMSYIRAIVRKDNVFLFHPQDMDVRYFASRFSDYLKGRRPPFLPTVFLGEHTPTNLGSSTDQVDDQIGQDSKPLPFECRALEGMLSHVCRQYYNRTLLVSPLVKNLLEELSSRRVDPATLQKLLPMKDVLSQFEIETTLMRNTLHEILQNDEDMWMMMLTERSHYPGTLPKEKHELVELLLENYCSQMVDISQEAYYLRKRIESTQSIIELKLDTYRNHMLRINMQLAISSIAIACSTTLAGVFGMNLTSGLENHPQAFYWVMLIASASILGVFFTLNNAVNRSLPSALDGTSSEKRYARAARGNSDITKERFAQLLKSVSGLEIDPVELEIIFRTFDLDQDGSISKSELNYRRSLREIRTAFSRSSLKQ